MVSTQLLVGNLLGIGKVGGAAPVSNILLVQSATNFSNAGATYAVSLGATAAGNGLIIIQEDADNPAAPTVPTGVAGSTCVQDATYAQTNNEGRQTYFNCPNISAGTTTVTIHVTGSGHSVANVREYSGLATAALLDSIAAAKASNVTATALVSNPIIGTQTDLAVGSCATGATATANMVAGTGWGHGKDFTQTADLTDSYAVDILNAVKGQSITFITGDSHTYTCIVALYKSAVAGSSSGQYPTLYADFENSTNGTTVTAAILIAGSHGGTCTWTVTGANAVVSTSGQQSTTTNESVNGVTYTSPDAGTRGIRYDPSVAGTGVEQCSFLNGVSSVSAGVWWLAPAIQDATQPYDVFELAGGGDSAIAQLIQSGGGTRVMLLEIPSCGGSDCGHITLPTMGVWYKLTLKRVQNGTSSLSIYDSTGTQVGATITGTSANFASTLVGIGDAHAGVGTSPNNYYYFDNLLVDQVNAVFPLTP